MNLPASLFVCLAALVAQATAGTWIRSNQAGSPWPDPRITVLADSNRAGATWTVLDSRGAVVQQGMLPKTTIGVSGHNPKPYGAVVSLSMLDTGTYRIVIPGADTAVLKRSPAPFTFLAGPLVRHLRLMRSGPDQSLFRVPSHLGDSACPVMIPQGPWSDGAWQPDPKGRKVSAVGGWYDAGDQIKFTLTTAYTTYYLLRAFEANPGIHPRLLSTSDLPDLLEEARHGLDYLDGLLIDDTTFVIEVGDAADHAQGSRLPQFDALDGKRPALVALSPMPMAYTAAALALGARLFAQIDPARAARWRATALDLHRILTSPGASRESAFLRDQVNDFYSDPTPYDNLALMERELHTLTGEASHLALARTFADSAAPSYDPGWTEVGFTVDADLAADHEASRTRLRTAMGVFRTYANTKAPLWGIPAQPQWGPLLGWPVLAAEALRTSTILADTTQRDFARDILDYALGRNNWGVSMVMSRHIPKSVRNIYSAHYTLVGEFPEGAVAEGPGSKSIHTSLSQYFSIPATAPETPFNTSSTVFFDHGSDFQTMETTISQQATFLYLLSVATRTLGDTVVGPIPPAVPDLAADYLASLVARKVPLDDARWEVYDDQGEGGISSVTLAASSDSHAVAVFDLAIGDSLDYAYGGLGQILSPVAKALPWKDAIGLRLHFELPAGRSARIQVRSSDVTDYDYFGAIVPGKGLTTATVLFRDMAQQGFGANLAAFNPAKTSGIELLLTSPCDSLVLKVHGIEMLTEPTLGTTPRTVPTASPLRLRGRTLDWSLPKATSMRLELVDAHGRTRVLAEGLQTQAGTQRLPSTTGISWIVAREGTNRWTLPVPPGR